MTINNRVLRRLTPAALGSVLKVCELVHLDHGDSIYEADEPIDYVDFPEIGVMSVVRACDDGSRIEVANIGNEGLVGMSLVLGVNIVANHAFCQVAGRSHRVSAENFKRLLAEHDVLRRVCERYVVTALDQISSTIACNATHSVQNRCARWLLLTHDRAMTDTFLLTQEFLAIMLGVSRTSVNHTAGILAGAGLIRYSRGKITILDRVGLAQQSCVCYAEVTAYLDRIMGAAEV